MTSDNENCFSQLDSIVEAISKSASLTEPVKRRETAAGHTAYNAVQNLKGLLKHLSEAERKTAVVNIYDLAMSALLTFHNDGKLVANRERTVAAHKGRRKPEITKIIEEHATALWLKKPSFRTNAHQTAIEIRAPVSAEIKKAFDGKLPKGWEPADEKIEIDRIRKRVRRIANPDDCQSSKKMAG